MPVSPYSRGHARIFFRINWDDLSPHTGNGIFPFAPIDSDKNYDKLSIDTGDALPSVGVLNAFSSILFHSVLS